eukprot:2258589-Amphidinium_carterae.1
MLSPVAISVPSSKVLVGTRKCQTPGLRRYVCFVVEPKDGVFVGIFPEDYDTDTRLKWKGCSIEMPQNEQFIVADSYWINFRQVGREPLYVCVRVRMNSHPQKDRHVMLSETACTNWGSLFDAVLAGCTDCHCIAVL